METTAKTIVAMRRRLIQLEEDKKQAVRHWKWAYLVKSYNLGIYSLKEDIAKAIRNNPELANV